MPSTLDPAFLQRAYDMVRCQRLQVPDRQAVYFRTPPFRIAYEAALQPQKDGVREDGSPKKGGYTVKGYFDPRFVQSGPHVWGAKRNCMPPALQPLLDEMIATSKARLSAFNVQWEQIIGADGLNWPFRLQDGEIDKRTFQLRKGAQPGGVMFSTGSSQLKPAVGQLMPDGSERPITDPKELKSGYWAFAVVSIWFNPGQLEPKKKGSPGVSLNLDRLVLLAQDEPFYQAGDGAPVAFEHVAQGLAGLQAPPSAGLPPAAPPAYGQPPAAPAAYGQPPQYGVPQQ